MNNLSLLWMCAMSTDQRDEEALYAQYADRIRRVATRCALRQPGKCSADELRHAGWMGLLHASNKFDPSKGEDLWSYAEYFVRGHIMRRLEQASSVHEKLVAMFLRSRSEGGESDDPKLYWQSHAENVVAAYMQLALEVDHDGVEHVSPEDELLKKERVTELQEAVATLDDREQHVIQARYTRDESFVEIAAKLNIHDSVASKNHKTALRNLRERLSEPQQPSADFPPKPPRPKATVMSMRPRGTSQAGVPRPSNRET
jgi:RNA polymerase sigma factor FliA